MMMNSMNILYVGNFNDETLLATKLMICMNTITRLCARTLETLFATYSFHCKLCQFWPFRSIIAVLDSYNTL